MNVLAHADAAGPDGWWWLIFALIAVVVVLKVLDRI